MPTPAENLALAIIRKLQSAGHTAYLAGGCVRDRLMNRAPKDFDVATSARPEQVLALFPRSQQVGAAFGVILVREKHAGDFIQVEVATFRADGTYTDGRHPDAVRFTTAEEDAQRRDFTCNGLFFDPLANAGTGQLHDFVGGQSDIQQKILRAIGDPEARFKEDHLRMLRAVRFAAKLDFTIDPLTHDAILRHAPHINGISRERIGEELRLILEHPSRLVAVTLLEALNLIHQFWPTPIPPTTGTLLMGLPPQASRTLALAALALDYSPDVPAPQIADALQMSLALSNDERNEIAWILEKLPVLDNRASWTRPNLKKLLANPRWNSLLTLHLAGLPLNADPDLDTRIIQMRAEGVAPAHFITGDTLIKLGAAPGPHFRAWLDQLYDRQLENEFPSQTEALAAARQLINSTP